MKRMKKVNLDEEKLLELYEEKKMSTIDIGRIFNISANCVYNNLKRYGIKIDHYGRKKKYKRVELKCKNCLKIFEREHWRLDNKTKNYFCSKRCLIEYYKGENSPYYKGLGKKVDCAYCKKKVYRENHEILRSNIYFCSKNCIGKWTSKNRCGKNHPNFKNGFISSDGYKYKYAKEHPFSDKAGYIKEHRVIVENFIGRLLKKEEVVHHIDGDRLNNNVNNLMIFKNQSCHMKFHLKMKQFGLTNPLKRQIENRWKVFESNRHTE